QIPLCGEGFDGATSAWACSPGLCRSVSWDGLSPPPPALAAADNLPDYRPVVGRARVPDAIEFGPVSAAATGGVRWRFRRGRLTRQGFARRWCRLWPAMV